uniref:Uncharacterized protein n=1 Tax=Cacopsylla melanoneura TaxID=428564 RepID=A0A8D8MIN8_9HEMI
MTKAKEHIEFGCEFENKQNKPIITSMPIWQNKPSRRLFIHSKPDSDINKQETVRIETIEDNNVNTNTTNEPTVLHTNQWNQFKYELRQSFVKILETHTLNDVDPFIR